MADSVLLLTGAGKAPRLLAQALARELPLRGIVVERRVTRPKGRLKRWARVVLGRRGYAWLVQRREPKALRAEAKLQKSASALLQDVGWPEGVERHETRSINAEETVQWCRERAPDLALVFGTGILRAPILRVPTRGTLNAHASLLPDFRGSFVEFWQVLEGRLDRAGVTFHFVDEGVDTGDIVHMSPTRAPDDVDPWTLRALNVLNTLEAYPGVARSVLEGTEERLPQERLAERAYRARDRTVEKRVRLMTKLGY